jgi:hypothetical protein
MPRQNRVTPFGDLIATPERGTFMGNRGILHDAAGQIRRPWQVRRWIVCVLEFRGRHRQVMTPGRYTELFFLDEATALAAGHRPCAECRHARFLDFCQAWQSGNHVQQGSRPTADAIDRQLHHECITSDRAKLTYKTSLSELPDGVLITHTDWGQDAYLLWHGALLRWTPGGYAERRSRPGRAQVAVLTPPSTVAAIRSGYAPDVHVTALA